MASYKDYKSVSAAKKAGSLYFMGKDGKKKLAVTAETLNAWKKKNKGKFKGSALTAWANNKGKDGKNLGGAVTTSLRPKKRPGSGSDVSKNASQPKITVSELRPPLDRSKRDPETPTDKVKRVAKRALTQLDEDVKKPGNKAARKARESGKLDSIKERAAKRAAAKKKAAGASKGGMMKKKK